MVALVKPQFEAGRAEADRGAGVIRDPAIHRRILRELLAWLREVGAQTTGDAALERPDRPWRLSARGLVASPITGRDGNHEYLLWLSYAGATDTDNGADAKRDTIPLAARVVAAEGDPAIVIGEAEIARVVAAAFDGTPATPPTPGASG